MDVVVYGAEEAPPGFRVVKSAEELRRHLGRAFIVVVGDKRLAEELSAAYFTREEWRDFLRWLYEAARSLRESRVFPPHAALRRVA